MKKIPSLENDQPNDTCNRGCYVLQQKRKNSKKGNCVLIL